MALLDALRIDGLWSKYYYYLLDQWNKDPSAERRTIVDPSYPRKVTSKVGPFLEMKYDQQHKALKAQSEANELTPNPTALLCFPVVLIRKSFKTVGPAHNISLGWAVPKMLPLPLVQYCVYEAFD
jgi:hypothetical protein